MVWPETTFRTGLREFDTNFHLAARLSNKRPTKSPPSDRTTWPRSPRGSTRRSWSASTAFTSSPTLRPPANAPRYHAYNSSALVDRERKDLGHLRQVSSGDVRRIHSVRELVSVCLRLAARSPAVLKPATDQRRSARAASATLQTPATKLRSRTSSATKSPHSTQPSTPPDVLVNITNDSWYWGSSELDMHLACDVFRAVETRKPLVIAANGGISAWIDASGRIRARSTATETRRDHR